MSESGLQGYAGLTPITDKTREMRVTSGDSSVDTQTYLLLQHSLLSQPSASSFSWSFAAKFCVAVLSHVADPLIIDINSRCIFVDEYAKTVVLITTGYHYEENLLSFNLTFAF